MRHYLITICWLFILAIPAWSQEEEAAGQTADTEAAEAAEAVLEPAVDDLEEEEEIDDSDLDEQTYEADDDDFIPTEEIPADEPIPFPSNI